MKKDVYLSRLMADGGVIDHPSFSKYIITVDETEREYDKVSCSHLINFTKKEDIQDVFDNDKVYFELHFSEELSVADIWFFNGTRGWYLNAMETIEQPYEVLPLIKKMLLSKFDLMVELYKKATE